MFLKHYDKGKRDIRFSQSDNDNLNFFLQETKTKNHSLQKL